MQAGSLRYGIFVVIFFSVKHRAGAKKDVSKLTDYLETPFLKLIQFREPFHFRGRAIFFSLFAFYLFASLGVEPKALRGSVRNRNNPDNRNDNNGFRVCVAGESRSNLTGELSRRCAAFTDAATTTEHDKAPSGWAA